MEPKTHVYLLHFLTTEPSHMAGEGYKTLLLCINQFVVMFLQGYKTLLLCINQFVVMLGVASREEVVNLVSDTDEVVNLVADTDDISMGGQTYHVSCR
ncbi:hypothetical protein RRG08_059672 [Elysia crispata]|uniref:Uncharacterized protein n=1 Tax=Elysia crispata TaxID=231223 RepID=A0AAE1B622_9GAST|nr:hypothetical protein RRG08_059672 [Elysia crispata]